MQISERQHCLPVVSSLEDRKRLKVHSGHLLEIPFYAEYRTFLKTRGQMGSVKFWDGREGLVKTSDEYFRFSDLEKQLQDQGYLPVKGREVSTAVREVHQQKPVSVSFLKRIASTMVPPRKDRPGLGTWRPSLGRVLPDRMPGDAMDKVEPGSSARADGDRTSRFRARLEELKEVAKDSHTEETAHQGLTATKNRKRVRTAVRRLLTERLFAGDLNIRSNKTSVKDDRGSYRQDKDRGSYRQDRDRGSYRQDRNSQAAPHIVQFVSAGHKSSPHQHRHGNDGQHLKATSHVHIIRNIQSNRLPPLGQGRQPRVLPLFPPVGGHHGSTCSQCRSYEWSGGSTRSIREGQKFGRQAAPKLEIGCLHTIHSKSVLRLKTDPHLDKHVNGQRNSADLTVTTKLSTYDGHLPHMTAPDCCSKALDLRKLLEELYRDKEYMDKLINTSGADGTEHQVCSKLKAGRDYLLQRAQFWLQEGPLPPRPPATDLGLRLQTLQKMTGTKRHQARPPTERNVRPDLPLRSPQMDHCLVDV